MEKKIKKKMKSLRNSTSNKTNNLIMNNKWISKIWRKTNMMNKDFKSKCQTNNSKKMTKTCMQHNRK